MFKNRLFTVLLCVFTVILILTFSISLPIYIRQFYYFQIDSLNITEIADTDKQTVKAAYDSVLDYLTLPGKEFSTGIFPYSENGRSHFEDCKFLFNLNIISFAVSFVGIIILNVLKRKNFFTLLRPFGKHYMLTCGSGLLIFFSLLVCIVSLDFKKTFAVFHSIFFLGKQNWVFDWDTDPIIKIFPLEFFLSCAAFIVTSIIAISIILIIFGIVEGKKATKDNKK